MAHFSPSQKIATPYQAVPNAISHYTTPKTERSPVHAVGAFAVSFVTDFTLTGRCVYAETEAHSTVSSRQMGRKPVTRFLQTTKVRDN